MKEKSLLYIKAIITSVVLLFVLTNFENIFYKPLIVYAAGTPSNDALWFEFDGGSPAIMNWSDYVKKNGYEGGVYSEEKLKSAGLFYNRSIATLTITGKGAYKGIKRIWIQSDYAVNLTVVVNTDWTPSCNAYMNSNYEVTNGAVISNSSGGNLTVKSTNGSALNITCEKVNSNNYKYNPIGIYSKGDVTIAGSIDLNIDTYNLHNGDYFSSWGIWAGQKVFIIDNAKTYISTKITYTKAEGNASAAIYSGYVGRIDSPCIAISSSEEQSFNTSASPARAACFSIASSMVQYADKMIHFGSYDGLGSCPRIKCGWKGEGYYIRSNDYTKSAEPFEVEGYLLETENNPDKNTYQAIYYALDGTMIRVPEVKVISPRLGVTPKTSSAFTMVTPGIKLKDATYYYKQPAYGDSWREISGSNIIPVDATAVKVKYSIQTLEGYTFAWPLFEYGHFYMNGIFNGVSVKSAANSNPDVATFEGQFDVSTLTPANLINKTEVLNVSVPQPGAYVPKAITATQTTGSEKATVPEGSKYKLVNLGNNNSSIPYREWWTNSSGSVINPSSSTTRFVAGNSYTYHVVLQALDGWAFAGGKWGGTQNASINQFYTGTYWKMVSGSNLNDAYIELYHTYKCPNSLIDEVEVFNVTEPLAGSAAKADGQIPAGAVYSIASQSWHKGKTGVKTGDDKYVLEPFNGTFEAGNYYTYEVYLKPAEGYDFHPNDISNPKSMEEIKAYVNGFERDYCYFNWSGSDYPRQINVRKSFFVPYKAEDMITDVSLTTDEFGPGKTPGKTVSSNTAGVTFQTFGSLLDTEIAAKPAFSKIKNLKGFWYEGSYTNFNLACVYAQLVENAEPITPATSFEAGKEYTFITNIDIGSKYFAYNNINELITTFTLNGIPASNVPVNRKSHSGKVYFTYKVPQSGRYIYLPKGIKITEDGTALSPDEEYTSSTTSRYTITGTKNLRITKGDWNPPYHYSFWKWDCPTGNVTFSNAYQMTQTINTSAMGVGDINLSIRTAPEGNVPKDISPQNTAIAIKNNDWTNNWGGESTNTVAKYDGTPKYRWPVKVVDVNDSSVSTDDYTLVEGTDYLVSYEDSSGNIVTEPTVCGTYYTVITGIGKYDGKRKYSFRIDSANISSAIITYDTGSVDYSENPPVTWAYWTGSAITPEYSVTMNGRKLVKGKDYEEEGWYNNTVTSTKPAAHIYLKGKGNYTGYSNSETTNCFQIRYHNMSDAEIEPIGDQIFSGLDICPEPVLTCDSITLTKNNEYAVEYTENMNVGTANVKITGRPSGGWTGTATTTFKIKPRDINDSSISFSDIPSKTYTGDNIQPSSPSMLFNSRWFDGDDFLSIKSYENNLFPGIASMNVEGKGNFYGTRKLDFDIYYNLSDVSYSGVESSYTYSGNPIKPKPSVFINSNGHGSMALTEGTHYTLEYVDNNEPGEAYVKVVPKDTEHFKGSKLIPFTIEEKAIPKITTVNIDKILEKPDPVNSVPFAAEIKDSADVDGINFTEKMEIKCEKLCNKDDSSEEIYSTDSEDIRKVKTGHTYNYVITIKAKGDWVFKSPADLGLEDDKPTFTFTCNGEITSLSSVEYSADFKTVTILVASDIMIDPVDISSATVTGITDKVYTGEAQTQTPVVVINVNGTDYTAKAEEDYKLTYKNNVNIGIAKVIVTGKGNFTGTIEKTFNIKKQATTPVPTETPTSVTPEVSPAPVPSSGKRRSDEISPENPVKVSVIAKTILRIKDEKDTKGSTFSLLKAKGTPKSKKSIKLSWSKVSGADKYMIFGNKCGKKNKYKFIKTVKGTSYTVKKLKKGTYYKYTIVAVKGDKAIATSKTIHVVTNGGKKGNNTKVKLSKTKLTLKKGKSKTIKAKLMSKKKVSLHRKVAWESDNLNVVKVNSKGKITVVGKGTCYVYAYAQNGVSAKIKITVK